MREIEIEPVPETDDVEHYSSDVHAWLGTGIHESAHAVLGWHYGRSPSSVQIHDGQSGICFWNRFSMAERDEYDPETWRRLLRQEVKISLAGGLAEEKQYPGTNWAGCECDLADARFYLRELRRTGVRVTIDELIAETRPLLDEVRIWTAIQRLTPKLVYHRCVDAATVTDVCLSCYIPVLVARRIEPEMRY
jgi:hypothetical protein